MYYLVSSLPTAFVLLKNKAMRGHRRTKPFVQRRQFGGVGRLPVSPPCPPPPTLLRTDMYRWLSCPEPHLLALGCEQDAALRVGVTLTFQENMDMLERSGHGLKPGGVWAPRSPPEQVLRRQEPLHRLRAGLPSRRCEQGELKGN